MTSCQGSQASSLRGQHQKVHAALGHPEGREIRKWDLICGASRRKLVQLQIKDKVTLLSQLRVTIQIHARPFAKYVLLRGQLNLCCFAHA